MQFKITQPDLVRSIGQRWLVNQWKEARGTRRVPAWSTFSEERFGTLDTLRFCDVVKSAGRSRYLIRFSGARVAEMTRGPGGDCAGKYLDEVVPLPSRLAVQKTYDEAVARGLPVYTVLGLTDPAGNSVEYERLLLPFGEGDSITRIVASLELVSIEGNFEARGLLTAPKEPPQFTICASLDVPAAL